MVKMLLILAVAFLSTACRTRIQRERPYEAAGTVGLSAVPSVGGSISLDQKFDESDFFNWAFELRGVFQGGAASSMQQGHFFEAEMGVRQTLSPGHPEHLYFRYGVTWLRATGDPNLISAPGDYFGGYAGAGYEWELNDQLSIGPEFDCILVNGEGSLGTEFLPRAAFNVRFKF